jgi:hypothetical protein
MDLRDVGWGVWTGLIWLKIGPSSELCENGNEPSGSVKCSEIHE